MLSSHHACPDCGGARDSRGSGGPRAGSDLPWRHQHRADSGHRHRQPGPARADLEQEDFTILDNGKPQDIAFFQNETSAVHRRRDAGLQRQHDHNLDLLKAAAEQFILRMLPAGQGQVGAFSDKIEFSGTFTNDRDDLIGALKDLQFGNPTRLYDAIDASIDC